MNYCKDDAQVDPDSIRLIESICDDRDPWEIDECGGQCCVMCASVDHHAMYDDHSASALAIGGSD